MMKSMVIKRSIMIVGRKTSVSLEDAFWSGLKEIAKKYKTSLSGIVADIDSRRHYGNLSSAIRLFVLEQARGQILSTAYQVGTGLTAPRLSQDREQSQSRK